MQALLVSLDYRLHRRYKMGFSSPNELEAGEPPYLDLLNIGNRLLKTANTIGPTFYYVSVRY